ncbi:LysE/ArgO family amino acid transporter [Litorivicinus lipolyticus]|uniref:LysE/ArgO family amino acid transporter n=1 Tax=Litorivicinus lipolyticus TaxID=418701 RepID=UPI003B5A558B
MTQTLTIFVQAFFLAAGLIMAIGAQNAHVLRQGIAGHYVGLTVALCAFFDTVLMTAGVYGFGWLLQTVPQLESIARLGGAAFLLWYGLRCARSACAPLAGVSVQARVATNWIVAVTTVTAFTLLNPHVYLDTVVLIGSIGGAYQGAERMAFAAGSVTASWVWFACLGYGARLIRPWFENPRAWQVLDGIIAAVMFTIAAALLWEQFV